MSSYQLPVYPEPSLTTLTPSAPTPTHVTFSPENDAMGVLWEHGYIELWELNTRLVPGPGKIMNPSKVWSCVVGDKKSVRWRQLSIKFDGTYIITALGTGLRDQYDTISTLSVKDGNENLFQLPFQNCRLLNGAVDNIYQGPDGAIFQCKSFLVHSNCQLFYLSPLDQREDELVLPIARFLEFCVNVYQITVDVSTQEVLYVGLSKTGKLYVSKSDEIHRTISTNATSFTVVPSFIIFTTNMHEALFAPISTLPALLNEEAPAAVDVPPEWPVRKVERGSRIVVAVPSTMSLVLQMPRGNLETINPRPLVMEVVKQDLDA